MKKFICYNNNAAILPDHYGKNIAAIQQLVTIARQDFPFLQDSQINVQRYGGSRYKGMTGIEFSVPYPLVIPADYIESQFLPQV